MKGTLPWVLVLILLAGGGLLFSAHMRQGAELARLQSQPAPSDPDKARGGDNSSKTNTDATEIAQLRKDHEDLVRLRNEIRQLREEKGQLTKQLQAAQQAAANPEHQQELQKALAEIQQLRTQTVQVQQNSQTAACINNLRQIDAFKQQWALENNRPTGSAVGPQELAPYSPTKTFPSCPAGGVYTVNVVGQSPACSVPGHILPK